MTRSSEPPGTVLSVAPAQHGSAEDAELVASASDWARIGACLVDLDPHPGLAETAGALREREGLLVRAGVAAAEQLPAVLDAGPHALRLSPAAEFAADARAGAQERGIAVHHEVRTAAELSALREAPAAEHVVLVFGAGLDGDLPGLAAAAEQLPGVPATATGLGESAIPVLLTAIAAGWHVRTGSADHPGRAPGSAGRDDTQLVARAAGIAKIARRPPLPPAQAAAALGIKT